MQIPLLRRRPVIDSTVLKDAIAVARKPAHLASVPEERRALVNEVAKALAKAAVPAGAFGSGGASIQLASGKRPASGPVSAQQIAEQAFRTLAPSSSVAPQDIEIALHEQGLDWVEPFAPGRPLTPFYGYDRRPRQIDYVVGRNITTEPRDSRIPFAVLEQVINGYDVAQICVVPGTLVIAKRGVVPIEEIALGEEVLTHKGRWRRVTDVMTHPVGDRQVFTVQSGGLDPLTATGEHPMLVARYSHTQSHARVMRELDFVDVANVEPRDTATKWHYDAAVLPALADDGESAFDLLPWIGEGFHEAGGVIGRRGRGSGRFVSIPARIEFSPELARVLGWYLAEGSASHGRSLSFVLGPDEASYCEQILADIECVFGIRGSYAPNPVGRGFVVTVSNSAMARLFSCGTARTKHLPEWAWAGGPRFLRAVLDAWALGDGCTVERNGWAQRTVVVTASRTLAWQMRLIAISAGLKPSIARKPGGHVSVIRGGECRSGPSYHVEWAEKPMRTGRWSFECDGQYLATAIRSVTPVAYEGVVHNLSVEEDESYVTTGGTVHNCIRHIINDLRSMRIMFRPVEGEKSDVSAAVAEAKAFLRKPDGKLTWGSWLARWCWDIYRYDAGALYKQRNRAGKVIALKVMDGRTIAPMLDYFGDIPADPAPAYVQFIQGIPWNWLRASDVIYQPLWPLPESPYGLAPIESVLINANCYSADTEVLTRSGWRRFADVDVTVDQFATRNPVTGAFEWQWASKYHQAPGDGTMYHAKSRDIDLLVTGDHRLLVENPPKGCPAVRHGDMWLVHAVDLYRWQQAVPGGRTVFAPATSEWDAPDLEWFPLPYSGGMPGDDYAAFMGMWLSEGSVRSEGGGIAIAQQPDSKGFEAYREALTKLLGREPSHDGHQFTFSHLALAEYLRQFGKAHEKFIPSAILEMSKRQLAIFWHFYVLGDGYYHPAGHVSVSTVSRRMADGLQEIVQKLGMSAAIHEAGRPQSPSHHQRWVLNTRATKHYRLRIEKVPYEGDVFCVSVPNKTLYVRRNGVPAWCANTDVRLQWYFLNFFTQGQVPEMLATAPQEQSDPDSLAELQETTDAWWNGNQEKRWGLSWLPYGTELHPYKPDKFDPDLAVYVMKRTVAAFNLVPQDLGFTEDINRSTGDTQVDTQFRVNTLPNVEHFESLLNDVLQNELGLPVEMKFDTGREKEDRYTEAQAHQLYVAMGAESSDEVRQNILGLPIDAESPLPRIYDSQRLGPMPLSYIIGTSGDIDPETKAPIPGTTPAMQYVVPGSMSPLPTIGPLHDATSTEPSIGMGAELHQQDQVHSGAERHATAPNGAPPPERATAVPSGVPGYGTSGLTQRTAESPALNIAEVSRNNKRNAEARSAVKAELRRWQRNARTRVAKGLAPRPFTSDVLAPELVSAIYDQLRSATTREAVDAVFAKAGDADPKARPGPGGWREAELVSYWAQVLTPLLSFGVTGEQIAARFFAWNPSSGGGSAPTVGSVLADSFAAELHLDPDAIAPVVAQMQAEAFAAGIEAAAEQEPALADRPRITLGYDWSTWRPGDPRAAGMVQSDSWFQLLEQQGIDLKGVTDKARADIAQVLHDGLDAGDPTPEIASRIDAILHDPRRAMVIARTEVNRAMTAGAVSHYRSLGLDEFNLLPVADPCPICAAIAAANPHPITDVAALPPIHPNCRCGTTSNL